MGAGLSDVREERLPVVGVACQGGIRDRPATVQLLALLDVAVGQGGVQPHARGLGLPRPDGVRVQRRLDLCRVGVGVPVFGLGLGLGLAKWFELGLELELRLGLGLELGLGLGLGLGPP